MAQMVESLPGKHQALSSIPSTGKKKKCYPGLGGYMDILGLERRYGGQDDSLLVFNWLFCGEDCRLH
jgi:hypothetical protein